MWNLMLIAGAGGFLGTCSRFLVNKLFLNIWKAPFPLATFTINVIGCFLFGLLTGYLIKSGIMSTRLNAFLITGFCGGFTTFSTFSFESFNLVASGETTSSILYMATSVITGFIAVWLGLIIAK